MTKSYTEMHFSLLLGNSQHNLARHLTCFKKQRPSTMRHIWRQNWFPNITPAQQYFHNLQTLPDSRPLKCSACLSNAYSTVSKSHFSDKPNHSGAHFLGQNVVFVLSTFCLCKKRRIFSKVTKLAQEGTFPIIFHYFIFLFL